MEIVKIYTLDQIEIVAQELSALIDPMELRILFLFGDLGLGKTALVKSLFNVFSVKEVVKSPSYSIQNEYQGSYKGNKINLYHWDLFRIETAEALEMLEDFLINNCNKGGVLAVEWSERLGNLEGDFFRIYLSHSTIEELKSASISAERQDDSRKIVIKCP